MRHPLALAAIALLGGCTVGRDYTAPDLGAPPAWRATASASVPDGPWWRAFDDPVLDRLEAEALAGNTDVEQALARVVQARAALRGSDAALRPSSEVTGTLVRRRQSENEGLGRLSTVVPDFPRTVDRGQLGLGSSWDLDFAGGARRRREAARAEAAGADASVEVARLTISAEVADAYVAYRGARARLSLLERSEALLTDQRRIMAVRVRLGEAPGRSLAESDASVAAASAMSAPLRGEVAAQHNRLAVLLGRTPSEVLVLLESGGDVPNAPDPAAGLPADVLRTRPDVVIAESRVAAASARTGAALAEYYPSVSLSGLVGLDSNRLGSFVSEGSSVLQGGASLRWRLFDFGRIDADVRAARGRERELLAAYRQAVLTAAEDVETSFERLSAARARTLRLSARRASIQSMLNTARSAFAAGEISRDALLDSTRALVEADEGLAAARQEVARAIVACHRALGSPVNSLTPTVTASTPARSIPVQP